jgi:dCMP deaminase
VSGTKTTTWSGQAAVGAMLASAPRHDVSDAPADARPSWDQWALDLAHVVATRADCTRRQVGAVILDELHRVVGTGYNGLPSGEPGCASAGACPRGQLTYEQVPIGSPYVGVAATCSALHAEENALAYSGAQTTRGCTMYVTHEPCENCRRVLRGFHLARVVWPAGEITL